MFRRLIKSEALRKRTSWILALVLIPPFIFFFHMFVNQPTTSGPGGAAGTIGGKPIPWERFQAHYASLRRQWESQFNESAERIPPELLEAIKPMLIESTWDRLLILDAARRQGLRVPDAEVASLIRTDPAFQSNGQFLTSRYYQYVSAVGTTPQAFEEHVRDQLLIQRMIDEIRNRITVTDQDLQDAYRHAHDRLKASLIVFDPAAHRDPARAAITEEELRAYYEAHLEQVTLPEQVAFEYAGVTRDQAVQGVTVTDEDILRYYEDHREAFLADDATAGTAGAEQGIPSAEERSLKPLNDVQEEIRTHLVSRQVRHTLNSLAIDLEDALEARWTLAEMAHVHHVPVQAIGPIAKGRFWDPQAPEPRVIEAAFATAQGRISDLVETDNGVYVLRVTQRTEPAVMPFEIARVQIEAKLLEERARQAAKTAAEQARQAMLEKHQAGWRFEEAALALGHTWTQPAPFTRADTIEPLGSAPAVTEAVFATPEGELSPVVETPSHVALVLPLERIAADPAGFEQQRETLRTQVLSQRHQEQFSQWLQDLKSRATVKPSPELETLLPS